MQVIEEDVGYNIALVPGYAAVWAQLGVSTAPGGVATPVAYGSSSAPTPADSLTPVVHSVQGGPNGWCPQCPRDACRESQGSVPYFRVRLNADQHDVLVDLNATWAPTLSCGMRLRDSTRSKSCGSTSRHRQCSRARHSSRRRSRKAAVVLDVRRTRNTYLLLGTTTRRAGAPRRHSARACEDRTIARTPIEGGSSPRRGIRGRRARSRGTAKTSQDRRG